MKYVLCIGIGFMGGIIYASAKFGQNPNIIFTGWGDSIKGGVETLKKSFNDANNQQEQQQNLY